MAKVVKCPKCQEQGSLQPKKTKNGRYWRVAHYKGLEGETRKIQWCYIGKVLPEELTNQLITHDYPNITQNPIEGNKLKLGFYHQRKEARLWADSSVWYECLTCTQEVAGSIPARSTTCFNLVFCVNSAETGFVLLKIFLKRLFFNNELLLVD